MSPLRDLADLERVPGPYEMFELVDGQTAELTVLKWDLGKCWIDTRDTRPAHDIPMLRVHVSVADKPELPQYWDITSKHLIAGLLGYLEEHGAGRHRFTITKRGKGPMSRFTLTADPIRT